MPSQINMYLQQLGKTPFFKKQKPTPYDEAISLIWYLENVFYAAAGSIVNFLKNQFQGCNEPSKSRHSNGLLAWWRQGWKSICNCRNNFKVAEALRGGIIKCYYLEIRRLKRRLTFKGVDVLLQTLKRNCMIIFLFRATEQTLARKKF